MINKLINYLKASYEELKKVVWPTRRQAINLTLLVIGAAAIMSVYLGVLDFIFRSILQSVILRVN